MAIKSVISAGTKSSLFAGCIITVGGGNAIKFSPEANELLGATQGAFGFIAPDDEDENTYYVAVSTEATNEAGERGYKLGMAGEKSDSTANKQLQFTSAAINAAMGKVGHTFEIDKEAGFEHNGLTFYPATVKESREDYDARVAAREESAQDAVNAQEDAAATKKGRKGAE